MRTFSRSIGYYDNLPFGFVSVRVLAVAKYQHQQQGGSGLAQLVICEVINGMVNGQGLLFVLLIAAPALLRVRR